LTTLESGVRQYVHVDEDLGEELMMLPTDMALKEDRVFRKWVERYAQDKEVFFEDFSKVFAKLIELGIQRDESGKIINSDNVKGGYHPAPKKSSEPGRPSATNEEAEPLRKENQKFRARL